jgi:acyl-CoA dehydrogenase
MVGMGSILEEAGKTLTPSPLFSTGVLGASLLTLGGSDQQKQTYLPQIVDGTVTTALALEESNRHDPHSIETVAKKSGDNFIISGTKNFVIDGHSSKLLIVAARTEGEKNDTSGITLFLVESDHQDVEITKTSMVDSRNAANIQFNDVAVSSENIIGEENNGASVLEVVLDRAQIAISAEMLGNASQAFDLTLEYLKERKQFGAVIGTFQALQHRAAEMYSELELTKSSVIAACNAVDQNSNDLRRMASLAKFKSGETNHLITNEAIQMHGGVGVTDEYDVGLFMKRARVTEQIFGNSEYHIDRYATLSDY